jgi:hypothetical protein
MWAWIIAIALLILYLIKPKFPASGIFPGIEPLLNIGPVEMDWTDILALALVIILLYAMLSGQMSAEDVAKILAGALAGKALSKES